MTKGNLCSLDISSVSFTLDACMYHNLSEIQTYGEASHSFQEAGIGLGVHAQNSDFKGLGNKEVTFAMQHLLHETQGR